ncbi:MAG TPA: glutathione S-transferase family protein [Steroidobacteraceae bacterium]
MTLKLYMHPLSSYCHKVLIAFYENGIPFEAKQLDNAAVAGEFKAMWPMERFPVLRDERRDHTIPESSIIIEYLALHYPGKVKLVPDDPDLARQVRLRDRFFDSYMHTPMQKVPADRLRPENKRDPLGVEEASAMYRTALDMVESEMAGKTWAMGDEFTMADCAAAPALFYGDKFFGPFRETHKNTMAYLDRLKARPSYARALEEAEPYMHLVPK